MIKHVILIGAVGICCSGAMATTFTVHQTSGPYTSITAAVTAAKADPSTPHTIEIIDGATYTEDVYITNNPTMGGSPNLDGLTVAAVPGPATVDAPGLRTGLGAFSVILALLGAPGTIDACGFYIEADGVNCQNLVFKYSGSNDQVLNHNDAVTVMADGVTFSNCTFIASEGTGDQQALVALAGDWPTLDTLIAGEPFLNMGFGTSEPVNSLTATHCLFKGDPLATPGDRNTNAFVSVDLAAAFSLIAFSAYIPPLNGTGWTFADCEFTECEDPIEAAVGMGALIQNCAFHSNDRGVKLEGGSGWTFEDCVFQNSTKGGLFHMSSDVTYGGSPSEATVTESIFCGSCSSRGLIEVDEGSLFLSRCIITVDSSLGNPAAIDWNPADYQDGLFYAGVPLPTTGTLSLDQCDIYMDTSTQVAINVNHGALDPPLPAAALTLTNSVIVSNTDAVQIAGSSFASGAAINIQYNDLYAPNGVQIDNQTGWPGTASNNLDEDPLYVAGGICPTTTTDTVNYAYTNPNLAAAGDTGQALGSQGYGGGCVYYVGPGQTYTTINAALEAIDYNDGCPDVVLIEPGVYDEQIAAKGNAGVDSFAFPTVFSLTLEGIEDAYSSHTDPLTFRGSDTANPPVITCTAPPNLYGFFPSNPGDYFSAQLVLCGNEITFQNVDIRHLSLGYGINGMGAGIVFQDCLFTQVGGGGEDFFALNNNGELTSTINPTVAADNEVTFLNCLIDMEDTSFPGNYYLGWFFYFHGFDDGLGLSEVGGVTFEGCIIENAGNTLTSSRGKLDLGTGLAGFSFADNYVTNVADRVLYLNGNIGPVSVQRNVFSGVSVDPALTIDARVGGLPRDVLVSDNIFANITSIPVDLNLNGTPATTPDWRVVNNTFYDYQLPAVDIAGSATGTVTLANNIFVAGSDPGGAPAVNISASGLPTVELYSNLYHNNAATVVDPNSRVTVNVAEVVADPLFANTAVVEPSNPGDPFPGDPFALTSGSPARDTGDNGWALSSFDVDGTTRVYPTAGTVDRGAQEYDATSPTPTPNPTISLEEALDNLSLSWIPYGDADWFGQNETSFDGQDSAKSGVISASQFSALRAEVTGPGTVSYAWSVSSEANNDILRFAVDNVTQSAISGEVGWNETSFNLDMGYHSLDWIYEKDGSVTSGSDAGWLDQVVWVDAPTPTPTPTLSPLQEAVDNSTLSWYSGGYAEWFLQSEVTHDTVDAAQSGVISDWQYSSLQTYVDVPGTFSFWWSVSSATDEDLLTFYGPEVLSISGETPWQQVQVEVPYAQWLSWDYTKDATGYSGSDAGWVDEVAFSPWPTPTPFPNIVSLEEALDNTLLPWYTYGTSDPFGNPGNWFGQILNSHDTEDAGRSGFIPDGGYSRLETYFPGPGSLSFWWSVSSATNEDLLTFYGPEVLSISGETPWRQVQVEIPDAQWLSWDYIKDATGDSGSDAGWVDQVEWVQYPTATPTATFSPTPTATPRVASILNVDGAGFPDVSVDVLVNTQAGRDCLLTVEDFGLTEDLVEQTIASVDCSGSATPVVDIVVVFDDTGSMGGIIATMKVQSASFADDIAAGGVDARFGLVSFKDDVELDLPLTASVIDFQNAVDALSADGGGDTPEVSLDAVMLGLSAMDFRPEAQKVFLLITDAPTHYRDDGSGFTVLTMPEVIAALESEGASVFVVSPDFAFKSVLHDNKGQVVALKASSPTDSNVKTIADEVEGFWQDIYSADFGLIANDIVNVANSVYTLAYTTTNPVGDGLQREVCVTVTDPVAGLGSSCAAYVAPTPTSTPTATVTATPTLTPTPVPQNEVWVDFAFVGVELGTSSQPYNTLGEGVTAVATGGTLKIKSGSTGERPRLTKRMHLTAVGGPVRIGAAGSKSNTLEQLLVVAPEPAAEPTQRVSDLIDAPELLRLLGQMRQEKAEKRNLFDLSRYWMQEVSR